MYQPYLTEYEYYSNCGWIEKNTEKYLISASRHIDSLTPETVKLKNIKTH